MKKKFILSILGLSMIAITSSVIVSNSFDISKLEALEGDKTITETITFTSKSAMTSSKNTLNLSAGGNFKFASNCIVSLGTGNSGGNLSLANPIQKIDKLTFTYSYNNCYEFNCSVGSESSKTISGMSFSGTSSSFTITPNNPSEAHNFNIYFHPFNTGSNFRIKSLSITYSCVNK